MFKNILIIGHSNIGDVCYDLVTVHPLRQYFPRARISFLSSTRAENILQGYRGIDEVFLFDKIVGGRGLLGYLRLMSLLRKERFDLGIVLKSSLMHLFLGIPHVWSIKKPLGGRCSKENPDRKYCLPSVLPGAANMPPLAFRRGVKKHSADIYGELLRSKGVELNEAVFDFDVSSEEKFADDFLAKESIGPGDTIVGILPVAAWSLKSWPAVRWNELAVILKIHYSIKVIAFGKSNNDPFSQSVLKDLSPEIITAIDKTTLRQAMALIKRCKLFIAPDSSLLHLASSMGVEAVGLYGPTSPEYFYPYFHPQNVIISKADLKCMPCCPGLNTFLCQKEFQPGTCMEGISVAEVMEMAKNRLHL